MSPFRSIKGRLLILTLCLSLIPIIIITTVYYRYARHVVKNQALAWLNNIAISAKAHTVEFMEGRKMRAQDFGSDGFIRDCLEEIKQRDLYPYIADVVKKLNTHLIKNKQPLDRWLLEIVVMDLNGGIIAATSDELVGMNFSESKLFLQGSKDTFVGSLQSFPLPSVEKCIPISTPITSRSTGELIGVLVNVSNIMELSEVTILERTGKTLEVYIVDNEGVMLTESRFLSDAFLRRRVDTEPIRKIANTVSGLVHTPEDIEKKPFMTGIYDDYRGVPVIGAAVYIPEYGWTLLAEIDKAEILAYPFRTLGIVVLVCGCTVGAIATSLGIISALVVSRPIKRLTDATIRFGRGDLNYRIKLTRKDEIGDLANSFNTMAGELKVLTKGLEKRLSEQRQLVRVAAHDLQEPLRIVRCYAQLLGQRYKGKLDADADEFISYVMDGAQRMQGLINDLLAYSRVEAYGKPFKPTDNSAAFSQAVANLQAAIEESGAKVTHDNNLPTVMADATQLVLLYQNLIGNAIKFRSKEPPRVHVSAEQNGNEWVFSVCDNGVGIDPQYFDRIFAIYQRLHNKTEYTGTGIGLAICKKIVERRGGRIWVESEPGKGSIFYFTIPKSNGDKQQ